MTLEEIRGQDTVPESTARWVGAGRRTSPGAGSPSLSAFGACRDGEPLGGSRAPEVRLRSRGAGQGRRGEGVCSGRGTPPRLLAGPAHRAGSVRRMQGAGKALHELLLSAQRQGCLTAGVYESAKVLNV